MATTLTYSPDYISPPGDTLEDVLAEREMSQAELAERAGLSRKTVNEIVKGKAPITSETALHLERVLGIPAAFWNARESQYREALARRDETEILSQHADWIGRFPYREMADAGMVPWIDGRARDAVTHRGRELIKFFGVASPLQWDRLWLSPSVSFRKSLAFVSKPEPVSAWLRHGEKQAMESIPTESFDEKRFRAVLGELRRLTRQAPQQFCPQMVERCASAGVAVVFTPQLPGARISGATRWLHSDLALIQLSLRYKTNDHFWFTFFHEAAHILLHGKKDVFLTGVEEYETEKEDAANEWAASFLIPEARMKIFLSRREMSYSAVSAFADELGIAPGIVVGQLQHRGFIPFTHLNRLKQTFTWRND